MNDVAFVYRRVGTPTAEIRGRQIATALGAALIALPALTVELAKRYRLLVYVKESPVPPLMQEIQDAGVLQVLDPLDNYHWREIGRRAPYVTHFLAANHTHRLTLIRRYSVPTTSIPHQHCNFDERRIVPDRDPPTLGFIGGRDHWPTSRRLVRRLPFPIYSRIDTPGPVVEAYLGVDVGFAYRVDRHKISYNAATKLVNFMSFGIPSVLNPETGYLEVTRHHEACLYAQSKAEFTMLVDELASNPRLRRQLGEAGYEGARPYHLRSVAQQYRALLESL